MNQTKDVLLVVVIAATIFFVNLGGAKLWDRDEPRNAGCAKEMMDRGDFVVPIFNDELRDAKPVLLYWLIISAYQAFGVGEFAARFWSALLAVGTVLCTYFIAQRLFDRRVGVLAAVMLATCLMFGVAARAATPDSALIFFSTAALAIFVGYAFPKSETKVRNSVVPQNPTGVPWSIWMAVSMYATMSVGVLAKGPIGLLMPTAIIGMYLLVITRNKVEEPIQKTEFSYWSGTVHWISSCAKVLHPIHFLRTCAKMRLLIGACMVLLIAGPWFLLVGIQTEGEFLWTFFMKEHLGRSTTSFENHSGSVFYYPMVMAIGFFPWSVFALPVLISILKTRVVPPSMVFLFCWVGVQVGLFTIVQTKLPSYVTPCYPALAVIFSYYVCGWTTHKLSVPNWAPRISFVTLLVGGLAVFVGMSYAAIELLGSSVLIGSIGVLPVIAATVALLAWRSNSSQLTKQNVIRGMAISASTFSVLFFGWILPHVSNQQSYGELLAGVENRSPLEPGYSTRPLGSFACLEPTWVFYGSKPIYELVEQRKENLEMSSRPQGWKPKPRPDLAQFLLEEHGQVITRRELVAKIEKLIGQPVSIVASSPYFMRDQELVLVEADASHVADQTGSPERSRKSKIKVTR